MSLHYTSNDRTCQSLRKPFQEKLEELFIILFRHRGNNSAHNESFIQKLVCSLGQIYISIKTVSLV